ncbi:hypothetical protein [Cyclobacterium amurskyense]|nr:hypothetical protein [Cyclobacterium amurskyense]
MALAILLIGLFRYFYSRGKAELLTVVLVSIGMTTTSAAMERNLLKDSNA